MKRYATPPCPVCGRVQDFAACWRDPAHGAYYAKVRRGEVTVTAPAAASDADAAADTLFGGAA